MENYQNALEILEKNKIEDSTQRILINTGMAKACLQLRQWKEASSYVKVAKVFELEIKAVSDLIS